MGYAPILRGCETVSGKQFINNRIIIYLMEKYKCQICNKNHNIFYWLESPTPRIILEMPEKEKIKRVEQKKHYYFLDREFILINGTIYIEINDTESFFSWKVWARISNEEFKRTSSEFKRGNKEAKLIGSLMDEIPFYEKMENTKVEIKYGSDVETTIIKIIDQDHPSREDQENGISTEKLVSLMTRIHHPELFKEKKIYDKSFLERIKNDLKKIEEEFINNNIDFS